MKKAMLIMFAIILASCSPKFYETSNVLNFQDYTGKDFIINPTSVSNGDFEPLGTISNYFHIGKPGKGDEHKVTERTHKSFGNVYHDGYDVSFEYMMKKTIQDAKNIGANGIIEFKILDIMNKNVRIGYRMEGTAVKFK